MWEYGSESACADKHWDDGDSDTTQLYTKFMSPNLQVCAFVALSCLLVGCVVCLRTRSFVKTGSGQTSGYLPPCVKLRENCVKIAWKVSICVKIMTMARCMPAQCWETDNHRAPFESTPPCEWKHNDFTALERGTETKHTRAESCANLDINLSSIFTSSVA